MSTNLIDFGIELIHFHLDGNRMMNHNHAFRMDYFWLLLRWLLFWLLFEYGYNTSASANWQLFHMTHDIRHMFWVTPGFRTELYPNESDFRNS